MDFAFNVSDYVTITATGQRGYINYLQETDHGPQYEVLVEDSETPVMAAESGLALVASGE